MITIRRASSTDAGRLTQIAAASKRHWGYPENWIQLWLPELTFSSSYILENEVWLAAIDEMLVGFYSFKKDSEYWWLENLWVVPDHMGREIGRKLFQHALGRCRISGESVLKIEADPNAQGFYEKMGACKIGEHRYEFDGKLRVLPLMEIRTKFAC